MTKRNDAEYKFACALALHLTWFARPGILWTHFPAGEHRSVITGSRLKKMGLRRGVPDYMFFGPGNVVSFLELKAGRGRLTPEQVEWRDQATAMGHRYAVAHTMDDALHFLYRWRILDTVTRAA